MIEGFYFDKEKETYNLIGLHFCTACNEILTISAFVIREISKNDYSLSCMKAACIKQVKDGVQIIKGYEILYTVVNDRFNISKSIFVIPIKQDYQILRGSFLFASDDDIEKDLSDGIELIGAPNYFKQLSYKKNLLLTDQERPFDRGVLVENIKKELQKYKKIDNKNVITIE